jgi:allantoinase
MMSFDLIVKNGTIVTPQATFQADIGVRAGKIASIGNLGEESAAQVYDAAGKHVFPGFIDEHVHSRDPGLTHKEDFAHSTMSAAAGGITTVLEMPNSVPPVMTAQSFHSRVEEIGPKAFVDFGLWGMINGDINIKEIPALSEAGVIGFKFFWGYALNKETMALVYSFTKDDDVIMPPDEGQIYDAFAAIGQLGKPVAIHAENSNVITRLTAHERASGDNDYASFLRSRPSYTEAMTIQAGITLAKAANVHLHILHIAAGEGVDLVRQARQQGLAVTGETCPHYLLLSDEDWPRLGGDMKIYPPIREKTHQARLWEGIRNGDIQALGSDHAPHGENEKVGDIWTVPAGACGVQGMVPLMLDAAARGELTLNQVAALLSENPARIWGLYGKKGVLLPGADADITVVDMNATMELLNENLYAKNKINPFEGTSVQGVPIAAFIRGTQVMQDGKPVGTPSGQLVKPVTSCQSSW